MKASGLKAGCRMAMKTKNLGISNKVFEDDRKVLPWQEKKEPTVHPVE